MSNATQATDLKSVFYITIEQMNVLEQAIKGSNPLAVKDKALQLAKSTRKAIVCQHKMIEALEKRLDKAESANG
ncbi:hypothetical protein W04_3342 [Pseudoalteromonas sp. SW0106-04]|uniref:hypothetical protein n=1 Tax=Pseudoalteromonas sp. SW0106-04 TaxID=1702169 RepID=UPI0006B657FA|nr:hypothetical protein [Pseudoalteromonas sp. SW0106-04]GAP76770.1 hypothetical protein W04_3342 [Pseudoalteromonas sp. SW0106-04]